MLRFSGTDIIVFKNGLLDKTEHRALLVLSNHK